MTTKPTFLAYTVENKANSEAFSEGYWHAIGAVWPTKDGRGYNIKLTSLPLDGRITILPPKQNADR